MKTKQPITGTDSGKKKKRMGYIPNPKKDEVLHIRVPQSVKERIIMQCKDNGLTQSDYILKMLSEHSIYLYKGARETVYNMAYIANRITELKEAIERANYLADNLQLNEALTEITKVSIRIKEQIYEQVKGQADILGCALNKEQNNGDTKSHS